MEADYKKIAGTLEGLQADSKAAHEAQLKAQAAQHDAETKAKEATDKQLAAEAKASELEGKLVDANAEIANKEKALATAEKEREGVKTQLATVVAATSFDLKSVQAMPLIEGNVIACELGVEPGLVRSTAASRPASSAASRSSSTRHDLQGHGVEYVHADSRSAVSCARSRARRSARRRRHHPL
jgi:hypothetical protein